jgi:hypothetical protein
MASAPLTSAFDTVHYHSGRNSWSMPVSRWISFSGIAAAGAYAYKMAY